MRVMLHALHVYPGATGGAETYLRELVRSLSDTPTDDEYIVLTWQHAEPTLQPLTQGRVSLHAIQRRRQDQLRRGLLRAFAPAHPTGWLAPMPVDLVHWTNSVIMLTPYRISTPAVLTLHDIQHEYLPEFFTPEDLKLRHHLFPNSVRRAREVIAISQFVADTLIERYQTPADKIHVIPHGIDYARFHATTSREQRSFVRRGYQLPQKFLIYPAGTWPHKNHRRLLEALASLKRPEIQLIFTGIEQRAHADLLSAIDEYGLRDQARHIGHIGWDEIPVLFQMARALIFPSLYEGFGMPILEAMAAGCPVATSNAASLTEVAGDAALLFDPLDTHAIAQAITQLWDDDTLTEQLRQAGDARAQQFTWVDATHKTIAVYQQAIRR